ncbi:MAG: TolC family protein [Planctomycetaceae bacterium]|nr:TolC family protein [Planctomycetaceae bacterium]
MTDARWPTDSATPPASGNLVSGRNINGSSSVVSPEEPNDSGCRLPHWWEHQMATPLFPERSAFALSLPQALRLALAEAPELSVLRSDWYIQQMETCRQYAAFDWNTFVDSIWNRDNIPVGSQLDGAVNRLKNRTLNSSVGLRRRDVQGGRFQVGQSFNLRNSNSQFILPNNQGTTRLTLQYERPLLRGAGEFYNSSPLRLAEIAGESAFDRLQAGVQDYLLEVSIAYWNVVLSRGRCLQSHSSLERAAAIETEMVGRTAIDVTPQMLSRARSETAQRRAAVVEAGYDVISNQETLLHLIYGSGYTELTQAEILPATLPPSGLEPIDADSLVDLAVRQRSEIHQAIREIRAASIRFEVAANEVLPQLNLVLTGYTAGLHGRNDVGQAFQRQFNSGQPSFGVGLDYELPYRNRAALAAEEQSQVAVTRMQRQFEVTVGRVTEEVRDQVIQRNKFAAVLPEHEQLLGESYRILDYTQTRRSLLADGSAVADLYLENLLQMQSRVEAAELQYLQTQIRGVLADTSLTRAVAAMEKLTLSADAAPVDAMPRTQDVPEGFHNETNGPAAGLPPSATGLPSSLGPAQTFRYGHAITVDR